MHKTAYNFIAIIAFSFLSLYGSAESCNLDIQKFLEMNEADLDSRDIAYELSEKINKRILNKNDISSGRLSLKQSFLVQQVEFEGIIDILLNGSLSYAEIVSTRNAPLVRLKGDQEMLGVDLDLSQAKHRQLIPKYSYLVLPDRPISSGFKDEGAGWGHFYGDVSLVLKNGVKDRSFWQYGNTGTLHSFEEKLVDPSTLGTRSPHLEALTIGPIELEDIKYLILDENFVDDVDDMRRYVPREGSSSDYAKHVEETLGKYKAFLKLTEAIGLPVFVGETRLKLRALRDGEEAIQIERSLNDVPEGNRARAITDNEREDYREFTNADERDKWIKYIFEAGLSFEEQLSRYSEKTSELARREVDSDD